ncbi:MAG TPA: GGDEF domain-containing protein [Acidimicrobiia bacterium]|jgi:diguanylate cyclase (GGDEF)-like protein
MAQRAAGTEHEVAPGTPEDEHDTARRIEPGRGRMVSLTALAEDLAGTESGLAIIYRALDALVEAHGLEDAAIVIEEPNLGRQVFRAGRRVLDEDDEALLAAPAGLYTEPPLPEEEADRAMVNSVCTLALRMDVLRYDAWHDPLTGLDDRRSFDRLLEMAVARSTRYGWSFALVLIDMDLLKRINDGQGHAAGDVALRDLAERMQRTLRYGDNAARIGGDEFAMILPNTEADAVAPLLDRIRATPGLRPEPPEYSHGIAVCPGEADTAVALFDLADGRLREDKRARKAQR